MAFPENNNLYRNSDEPFRLGIGRMPIKPTPTPNDKERIFQQFKSIIEKIIIRPDFKASPKTFIAKWLKEEAQDWGKGIPDAQIVSYFKRKCLGLPSEQADITFFGVREYSWEKDCHFDGISEIVKKETIASSFDDYNSSEEDVDQFLYEGSDDDLDLFLKVEKWPK